MTSIFSYQITKNYSNWLEWEINRILTDLKLNLDPLMPITLEIKSFEESK